MQSRRAALVTLASATASVALGGAIPDAPPHEPVFFNKPDYATLSRFADLIIPRTDTPGALDAHVPYRIDHAVSLSEHLQSIFRDGLATLPSDFTSLSESQQTAILTRMSEAPDAPGGQFFIAMKDLTIDWYYRSEEGLVKELGFNGNTFRPNFPGCTHPEHW
jgi:hypothetical protein